MVGFGSGGLGSSGPIVFNGGTLRYLGGNTQDISARIINTLTNSGNVAIDTNGSNVTFGSALTGSNGFAKYGPGQLSLGAVVNTYSGATTVGGGTLNLNFNATGAPLSDIINASTVPGVSNSTNLTMAGGMLFAGGKAGADNVQNFATTNIAIGQSVIRGVAPSGGTVTLNLGRLTQGTGGVVDFQAPGGTTLTTTTPQQRRQPNDPRRLGDIR